LIKINPFFTLEQLSFFILNINLSFLWRKEKKQKKTWAAKKCGKFAASNDLSFNYSVGNKIVPPGRGTHISPSSP
jgi:hypothetical protein